MRYALTALLLAALLLGCNKQADGPQTTEVGPPARNLDRLTPPPPEPTAQKPYEQGTVDETAVPGTSEPPPAASYEAQPPEGPPPPDVGPEMRVYVVQKGDTLWAISERLLGSGRRWKEIVQMNPGLVPEALRIGQTLRIPSR